MCIFKRKPKVLVSPKGTMELVDMASILLDEMEKIGSDGEIYLPDGAMKVYSKDEVKAKCKLAEVDQIVYIAESHDCDDFAAELFGAFAGLAWTDVHALNWFIDETGKFWWIEPQNSSISDTLAGWQGNQIRFFLGR